MITHGLNLVFIAAILILSLQLNFVYLLDIPPTYFLISPKDLHIRASCLIVIIS